MPEGRLCAHSKHEFNCNCPKAYKHIHDPDCNWVMNYIGEL